MPRMVFKRRLNPTNTEIAVLDFKLGFTANMNRHTTMKLIAERETANDEDDYFPNFLSPLLQRKLCLLGVVRFGLNCHLCLLFFRSLSTPHAPPCVLTSQRLMKRTSSSVRWLQWLANWT